MPCISGSWWCLQRDKSKKRNSLSFAVLLHFTPRLLIFTLYLCSLCTMQIFYLTSRCVLSQLFKRRNVDVLNEEEVMFESPLVDSYLSSPVTVSGCFSDWLLRNTEKKVLHYMFCFIVGGFFSVFKSSMLK